MKTLQIDDLGYLQVIYKNKCVYMSVSSETICKLIEDDQPELIGSKELRKKINTRLEQMTAKDKERIENQMIELVHNLVK